MDGQNLPNDLTYEIFVLRRMLEQLPDQTSVLIIRQLDKVLQALNARDCQLKSVINTLVDDTILNVKMQEFDLEATRRERDELKNKG